MCYRAKGMMIWVIGVDELIQVDSHPAFGQYRCRDHFISIRSLEAMSFSPIKPVRRGLAMLEVLIAVGLLSISVSSITTAIVAGQQLSTEAREKVVASVAAESLMAQLTQEPWETLITWHGYTEEVGTITDPNEKSIGGDWNVIGRVVSVVDSEVEIDSLKVLIAGRTITVASFNKNKRILATVERFIPEPKP